MLRDLLRLSLPALLLAFSFQHPGDAQRLAQPTSVDNFDIRLSDARSAYVEKVTTGRAAAASRDLARAQTAGLARLRNTYPPLDVLQSETLGTPEVVGTRSGTGFLTGPGRNNVDTLRGFLAGYGDAFGMSARQVDDLELVADYLNPAGNMAWVELEQRVNGLPVFQGMIRGGFTAKGELARMTGQLAPGVDVTALVSAPSITGARAIALAAASVGWSVDEQQISEKGIDAGGRSTYTRAVMANDPKAWLLYFPLAPGVLRLAWATEIWGDPMAYLVLIDAVDGTVLFRKNLTSFQTQPASYTVYSKGNPAPMSPSTTLPGAGAQAPVVSRTTITRIGNEGPDDFNALGWMTDGTSLTDGNNVEAGVDIAAPDGVDAPTTAAARVFDFPYNPPPGSPGPGDNPYNDDYRNGEITNMFYWANVYHDRLYRLGFTEAAGNFQNDNFGRGGVAGDRISAETRDPVDLNGANFTAPPDGTRGRMQLYVFTGPSPDRPSALDADLMLHELTHGTSNRLHSNSSGLSSNMAIGMGEGWSDFYSLALQSTPDQDVDGIYPIGAWTGLQLDSAAFVDNYYYGFRRFPYAVKTTVGANGKPHNPLTFADIDFAQIDLSDGAFPPAFMTIDADEVHSAGEIWAMALFEVRARFIHRLGFEVGNQRILQIVTDAMKLDPFSPTMLQGRDSLIAAANAGGDTPDDVRDIWIGFATRGMGVSARVTRRIPVAQVVEAFDLPWFAAGTTTLVSEAIPNGAIDAGETVGGSLCVTNNATVPTQNVTGTLLTGGGVTWPSPPQSFGILEAGATTCRTFTFVADGDCGATLTASLHLQDAGSQATVSYALQIGALTSWTSENFDNAVAPALPTGWTTTTLAGQANPWATDTTYHDVFVADLPQVSDSVLVTPILSVPAGRNRLTFAQSYDLDIGFDGGVLEISIDGGPFQDIVTAGGAFVSGGYDRTISTIFQSPIAGRLAWTGASNGYPVSVVDLPPAASERNIQLRWRMASDSSFALTGWAIDAVSIGQFVCAAIPVPTTVDDAYVTPFETPLSVPAPGLLANDTGGGVEAVLVANVTHGTLALNANGGFTYTPAAAYTGLDSFTYRSFNSAGDSNVATVRVTVDAPVVPPPPPPPIGVQPPSGLHAWSVVGNTVVLLWRPPSSGPTPTGFVLEGGQTAGEVIASLPLGAAPAVALLAPNGAFYLRVHSLAGAAKSGPSNEIRVFVNTPAPPSPPAGLTGLVNGANATLSWRNTFDGGAPTSILVDVAGSWSGTIPLGLTDTISAAGVPQGAYTFSVRAVNGAGVSASSNPITLTLPDVCSGVPQAPINVVLAKVGTTAYLVWDPPASGPAPSEYVLNVTGAFVGAVPIGRARSYSAAPGPGTYHVSVQSRNACGAGGVTSVQTITLP